MQTPRRRGLRREWLPLVAVLAATLASCGSVPSHQAIAVEQPSRASDTESVDRSAEVPLGVRLPDPPAGLESSEPLNFTTVEGMPVTTYGFLERGGSGAFRPILRSLMVSVAADPEVAAAVRSGDVSAPAIQEQSRAASSPPELVTIGDHRAIRWARADVVPAPRPDSFSVPGPGEVLADRVITRYEIAGASAIVQVTSDGVPDDDVRKFIAGIEVAQ